MGKKQEQARPTVIDVAAVVISGDKSSPVVTDSSIEVSDLLCEGPIKGIVSGSYKYYGKMGETGYRKVTTPDEHSTFGTFDPENLYTATGINNTNNTELGFLRSIYWNQVPVVDQNGYYNFNEVNVEFTLGEPEGTIPSLNTDMGGSTAGEVLDLSVHRNIGERLYGPDIKGGELAPTIDKAAQLKDGTKIDKNAKTYNVFNKECSSLIVNVKVNSLQENIRSGPKTFKRSSELEVGGTAAVGYGDTKARSIVYYIYFQPIFDERFSFGTDSSKDGANNNQQTQKDRNTKWYGPIREVVTGKIDQGYIRSTKIDLESEVGDYKDQDGFDGWRVRIVRTTPEPLTSFFRAISFVDSIVEIYGTKLRYPYSAMVYSKFDAENFQRVPARAYDTQLQKIKLPNNYDPIKRTYGKSDSGTTDGGSSNNYGTDPENFWDGGFHTEKHWSDNPAWCFYDLLTNERYGIGEYINQNEVDKWALYEISQYCDELVSDGYGGLEPRFSLNHLITNREEAYKLVNDLASAFRGLAYFANGLIFTVQDSFKKPIYQLNNSNVVDGDFNYSSSAKKARHTVAIVRYIDKRNFFQPAVEYVSDEEGIKKYGIRQVETTAIGCTSRGQARRFGLWILASEKNETDTVSFKMGAEGSRLRPGDIVQVFDNNVNYLKYSGRTNIVSGLVYANTPGADGQSSNMSQVAKQRYSAAYDSVILDSALNFEANKAYKFSLLTPTYNYDAQTSDLNSSGIKEIRRSSLQTLYFSGECTRTRTGEYRSNLEIGGSGVCTQIFFATGSPFSNTDNSDFTSPTGNRLDFENYTITGYTNNGVDIDGNASTSEEYKRGYNNGENLIWTIEPFYEDDEDFIKGHSTNYRIINVKESSNETYDVSALQYFSGKYESVESKVAFDNPFLDKNPQTPPLLKLDRKDPSRGGVELEQYELLNIQFETVGYVGDTLPNSGIDYLISIKTGQNYEITPPVFNEAGVQTEDGKDLGYAITSPDSNFPEAGTMGATGYDLYHKPYRQMIVAGSDASRRNSETNSIIDVDFFISEKADYYVSVFAISPYGVLSEKGRVNKLSESQILGAQSLIGSVDIYSLTTSTIPTGDDGTPGAKFQASDQSYPVSVPANNPFFSWQVGVNTLFDQPGVQIPNQDLSYRLTIREPADSSSINVPNTNIYFEFTGISSTNFNNPNFAFTTVYNNPNLYTTIENEIGSNTEITSHTYNNKTYYKVDGTGFLVQAGLSLPLREFDVVVEAHDSEGKTSVGKNQNQNRVWYNTIYVNENNQFPAENYKSDQGQSFKGYDIVGVKIDSIPSIVFPQTGNTELDFVSPDQAYKYEYPYLTEANIYPDGYLNIEISEARSTATNEVVKSQSEIEDIFSEAAGVVWYYSTGSEDITPIQYVSDGNSPDFGNSIGGDAVYRAKQFEIDPAKLESSIGAREFGMATDSDDNTITSLIVGESEQEQSLNEKNLMSGVFRHERLLEPGEDVTSMMLQVRRSVVEGADNAQVVIGVFDQLSRLAHYDEDGEPKKQTVTFNGATFRVPTIFTDPSINYSTIPSDPEKSFTDTLNTFSPSSFFVLEKSLITARDKDLMYKAWAEIEFNEFDSKTRGPGGFVPDKEARGGSVGKQLKWSNRRNGPDKDILVSPEFFGRNIKNVSAYVKESAGFIDLSTADDFDMSENELLNFTWGSTPNATYFKKLSKDENLSPNDLCWTKLKVEFYQPLSKNQYLAITDMNMSNGIIIQDGETKYQFSDPMQSTMPAHHHGGEQALVATLEGFAEQVESAISSMSSSIISNVQTALNATEVNYTAGFGGSAGSITVDTAPDSFGQSFVTNVHFSPGGGGGGGDVTFAPGTINDVGIEPNLDLSPIVGGSLGGTVADPIPTVPTLTVGKQTATEIELIISHGKRIDSRINSGTSYGRRLRIQIGILENSLNNNV